MGSFKSPRLFIFGDWDADGIVSSAVLLSSQRHGKIYPVGGDAVVDLEPAEPSYLAKRLREIGCPEHVAILDIPFSRAVGSSLRLYRESCRGSRIIYADHHISTHESLEALVELVDEPLVGYVPTSRIVLDRVISAGFVPGERIRSFVQAVHLMDQGIRIPESIRSLYKAVSNISKALTYRRDPALWRRAVEWISSPVPAPHSLHGASMEEVLRLARDADKRVAEEANILSISAQRLGILRYVDARKAWRERGATALASAIYRRLGSPVVLAVEAGGDDVLLVIKYPGKAYRLAKVLLEEGVVKSLGGHTSIAIAKIPSQLLGQAIEILKRAQYRL